jgi:hypothetical protein
MVVTIFKGKRSGYTPDFKVTRNDDSHFWVEIKDTENDLGLWIKTIYFEAQYADEQLFTTDVDWFKKNIGMLKKHIQAWEDCWDEISC